MPNPREMIPHPDPNRIRTGVARLKQRGPAPLERAYCDCGARLARVWVPGDPGDLTIGDTRYCPDCLKFMELKANWDRQTLVDIEDPRPAEKKGKSFERKRFAADRARVRLRR